LGDLTLLSGQCGQIILHGGPLSRGSSQGMRVIPPNCKKALSAMIKESSNDATSYIVDLLTNTSSGAEMKSGVF
jgi:hypothetical protein